MNAKSNAYENIFEANKSASTLKPYEFLQALEQVNIFNYPYSLDNIYNSIEKYYFEKENKKFKKKEEMEEYLKEKDRYNLLNYLITKLIYNLDYFYQDSFVIDYFPLFVDIINIENMKDQINASLSDIEFSYVCDEDIEKMIYELLTKFDKSSKWYQLYCEIKNRGRIICYDKLSQEEQLVLKKKFKITKSNDINCCTELENRIYIILDNSNTIKFVFNLIHEFSHYINFIYGNYKNPLGFKYEYSSIFYEKLTLDYFSEKGLKKDEIDYLNAMRNCDENKTIDYIFPIINYMEKYLKEMEITEEIEIGYYKNIIENYNERDREYFKNNMPLMLDAKVVSTLNCDKTINKLLLNFDDFYNLYPYITGTYLASIALSIAREDDRFLDEMKYITENISKLDASYIFNSLGLDIDRMNKNAKRYNKTKKN